MGVLKTEEVASLYRRYAGMVYQIGLMLLKNAPDAEDAVQTVFRRAMERDEPFGGPDHERAWLIVTARNECKNQLRHWWRTRRADGTELDNLTWEQPGDGEHRPEGVQNPAAALVAHQAGGRDGAGQPDLGAAVGRGAVGADPHSAGA